jgi:hypothetical protein
MILCTSFQTAQKIDVFTHVGATRCPEAGAPAYVISLRHGFFGERGFAGSALQARVADPMQWSVRITPEISLGCDSIGKEMGEGIGRVIGGQAARPGTGRNRQMCRRYGRRRRGRGEAIIGDCAAY